MLPTFFVHVLQKLVVNNLDSLDQVFWKNAWNCDIIQLHEMTNTPFWQSRTHRNSAHSDIVKRESKMKHKLIWLVLIFVVAGIPLLGCAAPSTRPKKIAPASVSKIEGTNLTYVALQPEAAKRLDIKTAPVREEAITGTRKFAGEVVATTTDLKTAIVQVNLTENDVKTVRRDGPAFILPLARDSKALRVRALPPKQPSPYALSGPFGTTFYEVSNVDLRLVTLQLVFVEIPLSSAGEKRKMVPYTAVLYDSKGKTWVYTNPEPLVFIRQPIEIDTIIDDQAILASGPPAGTAVVTVGGAELYGTEFGVGK